MAATRLLPSLALLILSTLVCAHKEHSQEKITKRQGSTQLKKENLEAMGSHNHFNVPGSSSCSVYGRKEGNNIILHPTTCNSNDLFTFFNDYKINLAELSLLPSSGFLVTNIIVKPAEHQMEIVCYIGRTHRFLEHCPIDNHHKVKVYVRSLNQNQVEYQIKFRKICEEQVHILFETNWENSNMFSIRSFFSRSISTFLSALNIDSNMFTGDFIKSSVLDKNSHIPNVAEIEGLLKVGDVFELCWSSRGISGGSARFILQKSLSKDNAAVHVALAYTPTSIGGDLRQKLDRFPTKFFHGVNNILITESTGPLQIILDEKLRSTIDDFKTPNSTHSIYGGICLVVVKQIDRRRIAFIATMKQHNVLSFKTDSTLSGNIVSHFNRFSTQRASIDNPFTFLQHKETLEFAEASIITTRGFLSLTVIGKTNIELLPDVFGLQGVKWNIEGSGSRYTIKAIGKSTIFGEDIEVQLQKRRNQLKLSGHLRAFSIEQLLANSGLNISQDSFYKGFMQVFKFKLHETTFEIDLAQPMSERKVRFEGNFPYLQCGQETFETELWSSNRRLHASTRLYCSDLKKLQEIMERLYKSDVALDEWVNVIGFEAKIGSDQGNPTRKVVKINADIWQSFACFYLSSDVRYKSLCYFISSKISRSIKLIGEGNENTIRLTMSNDGAPISFRHETVAFNIPHISFEYSDGSFVMDFPCTFSGANGIKGEGSISNIGNGMAILNFNLSEDATNVIDNSHIRLRRGSRGYMILDHSKIMVFESGVEIGSGQHVKQLNRGTTLMVNAENYGQLISRHNGSVLLKDILAIFGENSEEIYLNGAQFLNGYIAMVCNHKYIHAMGCNFAGRDDGVFTPLMITGLLYIEFLGITVEARYKKFAGQLQVAAQCNLLQFGSGKVFFQSKESNGEGPELTIRGGERSMMSLEGSLTMPGLITEKTLFFRRRSNGEASFSRIIENPLWYGETNMFDLQVDLYTRTGVDNMKASFEMYTRQSHVSGEAMDNVLQHYVLLAEDSLLKRREIGEHVENSKRTLIESLERVKNDVNQVEEKLADISAMFEAVKPTLHQNCIRAAPSRNIFGASVEEQCEDIDANIPCISWSETKEVVMDFAEVAMCEGRKIPSRNSMNTGWRTGNILLPKYEILLKMSAYLRRKQESIQNGIDKVERYLDGVKRCTASILPHLKEMKEDITHQPRSIDSLKTSFDDDKFSIDSPCYEFELGYSSNKLTFKACLNGKFEESIATVLLKKAGYDVEEMADCLRNQNGPYMEALSASEAVAVDIENALDDEILNRISSSKARRSQIMSKEEQAKISRFEKLLHSPAGNVITRSFTTSQAFEKFTPWAVSNDMAFLQKQADRAKERSFNASFSNGNSKQFCQKAKEASSTYYKLTRSLNGIAKAYHNGRQAVESYKRKVEDDLNMKELSLFRRLNANKTSAVDMRDMTFWFKESRKGTSKWNEGIESALEFQNRNSIGILGTQVKNLVESSAPGTTVESFVANIANTLDTAFKRGHIPKESSLTGNVLQMNTKNIITLFQREGVSVEDAQLAIDDIWSHGKQFHSSIKC